MPGKRNPSPESARRGGCGGSLTPARQSAATAPSRQRRAKPRDVRKPRGPGRNTPQRVLSHIGRRRHAPYCKHSAALVVRAQFAQMHGSCAARKAQWILPPVPNRFCFCMFPAEAARGASRGWLSVGCRSRGLLVAGPNLGQPEFRLKVGALGLRRCSVLPARLLARPRSRAGPPDQLEASNIGLLVRGAREKDMIVEIEL